MRDFYVFRVCAFRIIYGIAMLVVLLLAGGAGAAALTVDDSSMMHMRIQHDIDNASDNMSIYMLQLHGRLEANGTHFELKNSSYLNITLDSSEPIKLVLEFPAPEMITMYIESASGAALTQITMSGFLPLTTYHKYEDNYQYL